MAKPPARRRKPAKAKAKPRDREKTAADILAAARRSFATRGYAHTGMREIAAAAGITPALVVRYFGSKEQLFAAAIGCELDASSLLGAERAQVGRHMADHLFDKPTPEVDTLAILLLAATDTSLRGTVKRILRQRLVEPLALWLGGEDAEARAAIIVSILGGVWMLHRMVPVPPLAAPVDEATRARLAALLQSVVDDRK
jgi:AcrR family transcriptional regulator